LRARSASFLESVSPQCESSLSRCQAPILPKSSAFVRAPMAERPVVLPPQRREIAVAQTCPIKLSAISSAAGSAGRERRYVRTTTMPAPDAAQESARKGMAGSGSGSGSH
jgi:hypothetical protein